MRSGRRLMTALVTAPQGTMMTAMCIAYCAACRRSVVLILLWYPLNAGLRRNR